MIAVMSTAIERILGLTGRERPLAAGSVLFRAGERVVSLFVVTGGELRLVRPLPHGAPLTLQRAAPGMLLAEASLFAERYHCDAVATMESRVRAAPLRLLRIALRDDAGFAAALMRHLAHEVQRGRAQAEILSLKTVAERVDAWVELNGGVLPAKGGWRHLAAEVGVSPEALYRELARRRRPPRR